MPYAPNAHFDPSIITRGWENAGGAIATMIEKLGDRRKAEATEATVLRKLGGIYDPEGKDKYATMSLNDLRAAAKGHALQSFLDDRKQQQQQAGQNLQLGAMRLAAGRQQMQDAGAFDEAMSEAGQETVPTPTVPGMGMMGNPTAGTATRSVPITLQNALAAIARNRGAINAPQADNQLGILERMAAAKERNESKSPLNMLFREDPVSGTRFATFGNTALPSGVNPEVTAKTPLPDVPEGLELDSVSYDARGRPQVKFRKKASGISKLQKTPAQGVWYDPDSGKFVHETGNGIFQLLQPGLTDGTGSTGNLPVPAGNVPAAAPVANPNDPLNLFKR